MTILRFPRRAPTSPENFITILVPGYFSIERLARIFGACGYRLHSRPDGNICVLPKPDVAHQGEWEHTHPNIVGPGLAHHRFAQRLRQLRVKNHVDEE